MLNIEEDNYRYIEPFNDMTTSERCKAFAELLRQSDPKPQTFDYELMLTLMEAAGQIDTLSTSHERLLKATWRML